jgi:xanthine dehydrogenase small subunit
MSLRFLANDALVETESWGMTPALDYIRKDLGLTGTKEGCREGDCGACAIMLGERRENGVSSRAPVIYRAMPSCLLALGELGGRHLVTIEGLASRGLTPVMRAISEANGSQCGFCSPGFVISLTAYLVQGGELSVEGAFSAVEGNLCRCTGYGSIKRAATRLVTEFSGLPLDPYERIEALVRACVLPPSCAAFARGELLPAGDASSGKGSALRGERSEAALALGGGSDFFVRNPEPDPAALASFALLDRDPALKRVELVDRGPAGATLELGAALTWREFFSEPRMLELVPGIERFERLLASPLVRERATLGGNIANASPVGDMTAILLALGASLRIAGPGGTREFPLKSFFISYKIIALSPGEIISSVLIPASRPFSSFNFEKASKRERLDIAAVNTAASFEAEGAPGSPRILRALISAGGVAPMPLLLEKASSFLAGRVLDADAALEAARIAAAEASPISDVRGDADYRRRILERLVLAHFIVLFPGSGVEEAIS